MAKMYPFSMAKNAHTIELVRNNLYLNDETEKFEEVTQILLILTGSSNGRIAWVDGKTLAKAKEIVAYGNCLRDRLNHR